MSQLEVHRDERGWLAEFVKSPSWSQVFVSRTKPGATRGNHWHETKVEKFLVVGGEAQIVLRERGTDRVVIHDVCGKRPTVVDIPAGHVHAITNTGGGDLITVFWASEVFDPERSDTFAENVWSS